MIHPKLVREAKEAAAAKYYADNMVGDVDDRSKADMGEQFWQGLVGGAKVDNQTLLAMADQKEDVKTFAIDEKTGMPVIAQGLEDLLNTYGAPGEDNKPGTEFSDAIKGKSDVEKNDIMLRYMKNKGVALDVNLVTGNARMLDAGTKARLKGHSQFLSAAAQELSLGGIGGASGADAIEALAKKREAEEKAFPTLSTEDKTTAMKKRMEDSSKQWTSALAGNGDWMANALKEGDGNTAFDMALKRSIADPAGFAKDLTTAKVSAAAGDIADAATGKAGGRVKHIKELEDKIKEAQATPDQKTADNTKKILDLLRSNLK